jgi:hypothetical protein
MRVVVFLAFLFFVLELPELAAEERATSMPWVTTTNQNAILIKRPESLVISCGKGNITVNLIDGSVKFTDCSSAEGAEVFWEAIHIAYGAGCPR